MSQRRLFWTISVRELAQFVQSRGDLNMGSANGLWITPQQGALGHRLLQSQRSEAYKAEVFLKTRVTLKNTTLEISGRADGIFFKTVPQVLEEIKTNDTDKELRVISTETALGYYRKIGFVEIAPHIFCA